MDQRERLILEISGNNFPKWWREQKYPYMNARLVSISTDEELSAKLPSIELPEAEVLVLNFQSNTSYALPQFVERMNKLKMLLVINYSSGWAKLDNFEVLGSLSNLRSLRLDGIKFSCINECPAVQLKNIHKLYLKVCSSGFFVSQVFPNLKELILDGDKLIHLNPVVANQYPRISAFLKGIETLIICSEAVQFNEQVFQVPDWIVNLKNLKFLKINRISVFRKLPKDMGELMCLTHLIIQHCSLLKFIPKSVGNLVNLQVLSVRGCTSLSNLPESIINLQMLEILDIHYCYNMRELPEQIGKLKSLRKLDMSCCDALEKLPQSVSDLEQLEEVICSEWAAEYLWRPLLPTLKNLSIVV